MHKPRIKKISINVETQNLLHATLDRKTKALIPHVIVILPKSKTLNIHKKVKYL